MSTFSQVEKWVSESTNSQRLIENLKKKLADGEMEALEKQLKAKKLKRSLCFNSDDVKAIDSNQELRKFLEANKDAKFPKLAIKLFFENDRGHSVANEKVTETDDENCLEEDMNSNTTEHDLSSSGYGSSDTSSFNSNTSHSISRSEDQLQSHNLSATHGHTQNENGQNGQNETTSESKPKNTGMQSQSRQAEESGVLKLTQGLHATQCQNVTHAQTHSEKEECTMNMLETLYEPNMPRSTPFTTDTQSATPPETDRLLQSKDLQINHDLLTRSADTDMSSLQQLASDYSKQRPPVDCFQSESIEMQEENEEITEEAVDKQEMVCPGATQPLLSPNLCVASLHCQHESPVQIPACVVADDPVQYKTPEMNRDPDPVAILEVTETQKQCKGSDIAQQTQEAHFGQNKGPKSTKEQNESNPIKPFDPTKVSYQKSDVSKQVENILSATSKKPEGDDAAVLLQKECKRSLEVMGTEETVCEQSESSVQIHQEGKENTEETMDEQEMVNEPFTGNPGATEPLLSANLSVANVHYQHESLVQIQHENIDNSPSEAIEMATETQKVKPTSFSTPLNNSTKAVAGARRGQQINNNRLKKRKEERRMLRDWIRKKCTSEQDLEKVLKCISIEIRVEHPEYPLFIVDNVMVYKDPKNDESQIVFVSDEKMKTVSQGTRTVVNYQMWCLVTVSGVKKAVVLNQTEHEVRYSRPCAEGIKEKCERCVFEVFAPALAVFKNVQRQERLYSLIQNQ